MENFPGFPEGIAGPELMERLFAQARNFDAEILEEFASDFEFKAGGPHRMKIGDQVVEADAVILANGARARWLGAPDEARFINMGISACATCDGPLPVFRNKEIYVLGGGDSACEEAIFLTRFASKVFLVHRRDTLRASKVMAARALEHDKIEVLWNTAIVGYKGETALEGLVLQDTQTKEQREVSCGGLFMAIGHVPNTAALQGSAVQLDSTGYIQVRDHVFTNIEGVFAAGDCHDTIYRQAITAAGLGCMAAITAERWLEEKH